MEDAHCAVEETIRVRKNIPIINNNSNLGREPHLRLEENEETINIKIFGVFDGHGGSQSAKFIATQLPKCVIEEFRCNYLPNNKPVQNDMNKLIKNAFLKCDYELFIKHFQSGSTAVLLVILNDKDIYIANTGDSRCILSRRGAAKNLSFDHKPNNIGELIRIQDAGGMVNMGRVNGSLALSRAFGDFNFKKRMIYITKNNEVHQSRGSSAKSFFSSKSKESKLFTEVTLASEETQVTVEPEIINLQLNYVEDEFLILACDGIWDSFKNSTLVELVRHELCLGNKLDKICEKVIDNILSTTDTNTGIGFDNMTILIVAVHNEHTGGLLGFYSHMKERVEKEKGLTD